VNKKLALLSVGLFCAVSSLYSQNAPFNLVLEPMSISGLGGLQSYAHGQHNGKWLIVGGRLDGLHRRQPFAAFDLAGHNNQLIVVDPVSLKKWSAPLSSLPVAIQEQLSSTNMQFHQQGDYLYCTGGYGYSAIAGDHTTFAKLTAIKVSNVIDAVINNNPFTTYFRQITDPKMQVTGGHLKKINNDYYLLGGQKFLGRYNPQGPSHGPGFTQVYTNAIHKFTINDNGTSLSISHHNSFIDSLNLHRRDYNAESQILPNGSEGITMFSGVFQLQADLPFLNSVSIDSSGYSVNNTFQQYYNHYHCAVLPLYSASKNEMHNVFFGGIAQYYDSMGILVQDNNVPFVKTIARVTRNASGVLAEYKLPIEMPVYLGAGSEFMINTNLSHYNNDVIKLDDITNDSTLVGYIYGGINSSAQNIFFTNTGTQSTASSQIFKVTLVKNKALSAHFLNEQSIGSLKMQVFPNPNDGEFVIKFNLSKKTNAKITIYASNGQKIDETVLKNPSLGENSYSPAKGSVKNRGVFFVSLETAYERATQKIIIE
jgi:hypothetical protein